MLFLQIYKKGVLFFVETMNYSGYVDLAEQIQAILDVKERTAKSYIKFMREKEIILKDPSNQSYYIIGNLKQASL